MSSIEAIVNRQILKWELESQEKAPTERERVPPSPIVTISRQTGSRGSYFGSRLAQRLGYQRLHREAIDLICKTSGYHKRIIESLDHGFVSNLELAVESILTGQSVDHSDYVQQLCEVVLSMSRLGGVVLMGRGGSFILGPTHGFHIRVVCPKEKRIENLMKYKQFTKKEAIKAIEHSDEERTEFVRRLFDADVNDPHYYDIVLNSALIDVEELVDTAEIAIKGKRDKLTYPDHDQI